MAVNGVFDLETTGSSRQRGEIIEVAAVVLEHFVVPIEDAGFSQFVRPTTPIPPFAH
jgi:DNA polymerase III epsilon subunit-like protein